VKQESGGLLLLRRITPRSRAVMRSIFTLALIHFSGTDERWGTLALWEALSEMPSGSTTGENGVVLAPPRMFLVARGQNKSMQVAIGEHALSGNIEAACELWLRDEG
jgi:hypothetical protein